MTSPALTPDMIRANAESQIYVTFNENTKISATLSDLKVGALHNPEFRIPFSFVLTVNEQHTIFPQSIYAVDWEGVGTFDVFLVPVGHSPKGIQYQAVFG